MANVLLDLSDDLAAVVSKAGASVVRVEARRRLAASGVVWPGDGLVVTAHHVVEQEGGIRVGLADGQVATASLVGRDPTTDLALLRVEASLTAPVWADSAALRAGHLVLALGRPGQSVRATLGIVSALGGGWVTPAGGRLESYLQPDVVMYPGFSGGPLVGSGSLMLGVNTSAVLRGTTVTIPTSTVRRTVEALLAHGRIRRGYLGIGSQPARLPASVSEQLGQETGLLIINVAQGSPAEQGGLFLGDTLVALDGRPVRSVDELLAALSALQIGSAAQAKLVRGGMVVDLRVTIGEHP
jgi:S1-C subfamily serine protease